MSALERFEVKYVIDPDTLCWIWIATRHPKGYGLFGFQPEGKSKSTPTLAHRASWELFVGPIPNGLKVLHNCDNPPCVNPDHLFLGTQQDNMNDMATKGRRSSACFGAQLLGSANRNSKLSDEQVEEIRASTESHEEIARQLGLNANYVGKIRNGKARTVKS